MLFRSGGTRGKPSLLVLALAAAGVLVACDGSGSPARGTRPPPTGVPLRSERPEPTSRTGVERIVSLSPFASATLVALGAATRLVGVDPVSAQQPMLGHLPIVQGLGELEATGPGSLAPDLVLAPARGIEWSRELAAVRLRRQGIEVIEVSVHDFDDAYGLARELGRRLGWPDEVDERVRRASRPLAAISAESFGRSRPRIAAILELDPLTLAGGHSFATDLVEIAGAESVSHGTDAPRIVVVREELRAMRPRLVLHVSSRPLTPAEQEAAREQLGAIAPLEFLVFDPERFLADDAVVAARRIRSHVAALSRHLESASRP